ncbi:MAG: hypothetical protein RMA76_14210 [Deltaproteobacteria bacterium]|jgi:hypothetical protein
MLKATAIAFVTVFVLAGTAEAAEYKCKGNRVEKSGSTKYTVRTSGSDYKIEKSGSTKGVAKKRGSKYAVEVSGSTQATIEKGKIYKSGSTWGTVSEAQRKYDCPDVVAATLWVLDKKGKL